MNGSKPGVVLPPMTDDQLEAWLLTKINRRPLVRSVSALEGFLSALVAGPSLPNPFIPIHAALGIGYDPYDDGSTPASAALAATITHYDRISQTLSEAPLDFSPRFIAKAGGGVEPRPWCQAFYTAVELNRKHWKPLLDINNHLHGLLLPVLIYCTDKKGRPVLGPPRPGPETEAFLEHEAHRDIAVVVAAIRDHHRVTWYDEPVPAGTPYR